MPPTTYWVSPDVDCWRVQREGAARAERICVSREEAVDLACRIAAINAPALVRVQSYAGAITAEFEFGRNAVSAAE